MNPTQTGIAVALALVVVAAMIAFPSLSPLHFTRPIVEATTTPIDLTQPNAQATTTTMSQPSPLHPTQLEIVDEVVGTGATAASGNMVTVNYVGTLTSGIVFDASAKHGSQGFTFKLGAGQVIQGWDKGIIGMKEGGKRKLVIPAPMAYGAQGIPGVIPPNAPLIFEVELLRVQ